MLCHNLSLSTSQRIPKNFLTICAISTFGFINHPIATAETTPDADFQVRCTAPGVVLCEGFDNAETFIPVTDGTSGKGLYASKMGAGPVRGFQDLAVKASGQSSLRFDIYGKTTADTAGKFWKNFGQSFGENTTFYVQYQQRFSPEMLTNNWGNTSWKQSIIHGKAGGTCQEVEITSVNYYRTGIPIMYTSCGARSMYTTIDGSSWTSSTPQLIQQGTNSMDGYNCTFGSGYPSGTGNGQGCFKYPPNQWITFYYKIQIGNWNQANSKVEAWVSVNGQPYKEWVKIPNMTLKNNYPDKDNNYSMIMLTPYMTGKDSTLDYPTAYTWYDELIVSSQPIVAPGASSGYVTLNPPSNLQIVK